MRLLPGFAASIVPVLALISCGGSSAPETKTEAPAASAPAPPSGPTGSISGKVLFAGEKPKQRPISMDATPACARNHKEAPMSEEVVVNDNGTLRNVFVYVKSGLPNAAWPAPAKITVDQHGCVYKPHVVGLMVNQPIEFLNSDDTSHNIHPLPRTNNEWNETQAAKGDPKVKSFPKAEVAIPVKCNLHPWMRMYIAVVDHPFFAVTGEDGSFELKGLPPGDYTVEVWHERYQTQTMQVTVTADGTAAAEFTYKGA